MQPAARRRERQWVLRARAWPLWELRRGLVAYIVAVVGAWLAAVGVGIATAPMISPRDALLVGALLLCSVATVEMTRRAGENAGFISDIYGVWELPLAILLPPVYAMTAPILRMVLTQRRIRSLPLHKRVFSTASIGLSYGAASALFHVLTGSDGAALASPLDNPSLWMLAVALAAMAQWAVNSALVLPAVKAAEPGARIRSMLLARETMHNDIAELCVAVVVTFGLAISLVTVIFALPFVTLLQRSVRHANLVNASRIDAKTGLLNSGTWEREAAAEVARAVRTRTPLALALIDVDHFKAVNDVHGHLAGDKALRAIARTFTIFLRDYDLAGRFGGEEFVLLLPQTGEADAYLIAERLREHIASMPIEAHDGPGADPFRLTVSIGVSALGKSWDSGTSSQLTDLLAAADTALYRAKRAGRDQVWMVTDTKTVSAAPQEHSVQLPAH